jgi:predicted RNA binding protein YcfA (HicA-like mRNA interferase family)
VIRRLRRLGFEGPVSTGKHQQMHKGGLGVRIPNPHGDDVGTGLIAEILRQAGVSRDEWESAGD